jgi:7,8-dihydroneopterin aldolase/epimerase/oxygenase
MRDRLALRGLRARGRHGVLPAERELGQDFVVDVELRLDTSRAAAADDLTQTVDYGSLAAEVTAVVTGAPVALIETLAQRVADRCLAEPLVDEVEVTVHKPQAPLRVPCADVTVTITRSRR